MIYYAAIFLIPLLATFVMPCKGQKADWGLLIYFVILLAFVGLRDQVGPDWQAYQWDFESASKLPWSGIFAQREPGFFVIEKVFASLGTGIYGVNFTCALLFLSGIFLYARTTVNPWMAITMVVPYLVFIVGMSGIRQAAAIGLMLCMFASWRQTGTWVKAGIILAAMSIHTSAVLLFVFLIVRNDRYLLLRLFVAGSIVALSASAVSETAAFARYHQTYIETDVSSAGALAQVALSGFPAMLYLFFRRQIRAEFGLNKQVELAAWMALAALPLVPLSSTGVSRAALYLSFVQMWAYPAFAYANTNRLFVIFSVVMVSVAVFLVYFQFGTHVFAFLPYKSII